MLTIDMEILHSLFFLGGGWFLVCLFLQNSQCKMLSICLSMYVFFSFFFSMYFVIFVLSAYDGYTQQFITEDVD